MRESSSRLLLIRPRGGLNDVLCQIESAWQYAEEFSRRLIIDSTESGLMNSFGEVWESTSASRNVPILKVCPELLGALDGLETFPRELRGGISSLRSAHISHRGFVWAENQKISLNTPLDRDYDETLVVREASGGGQASINLLNHIRLRTSIADEIASILGTFPNEYFSVHIREGDDSSPSWADVLRKVKSYSKGKPVLVISDSRVVLESARQIFGHTLLLSENSDPPPNGSHYPGHYRTEAERKRAGLEAIIDVMLASNAKRFFYTRRRRITVSGYSLLCANLAREVATWQGIMGEVSPQRKSSDLPGRRSEPKLVVVLSQIPTLMRSIPKFLADKTVRFRFRK